MARHGTDAKTCGMMNDEQPSRMFMDVLLDVLDCFRGIYIYSLVWYPRFFGRKQCDFCGKF